MRSATESWGTFYNYPWSDQVFGFLWRTVSEHPVGSTKNVLFFFLKAAPSTISLTFLLIPQEMAASLVFFCSAPKIRKQEISGGAEILKDRLNNAFLIRFSRESIAICCATETVCAVVTPGLWVCHHRDESLVGAPVVSQLAACLWWGPGGVNEQCCGALELPAAPCIAITVLRCQGGEQPESAFTFLIHIFQYLQWLEAINYAGEIKLAFLGFITSRKWVKLMQQYVLVATACRWQEASFTWGLM